MAFLKQRTLSLSLAHTHSLFLSLTLTHTHTLSLSLPHTHKHTLSLSLTHTHSLGGAGEGVPSAARGAVGSAGVHDSLFHSLTLSHTFTHTHTHTHVAGLF